MIRSPYEGPASRGAMSTKCDGTVVSQLAGGWSTSLSGKRNLTCRGGSGRRTCSFCTMHQGINNKRGQGQQQSPSSLKTLELGLLTGNGNPTGSGSVTNRKIREVFLSTFIVSSSAQIAKAALASFHRFSVSHQEFDVADNWPESGKPGEVTPAPPGASHGRPACSGRA